MAVDGGPDEVVRLQESFYEPFASFSAWAPASVSGAWGDFLRPLDAARKDASPEDADNALEFALRSAALETGAIEGLYATNRGPAWSRCRGRYGRPSSTSSDPRSGATSRRSWRPWISCWMRPRRPMTLAWLRSLHAQVCANQKTYKLYTPNGVVERPLEHGAYKTARNTVSLADGTTH